MKAEGSMLKAETEEAQRRRAELMAELPHWKQAEAMAFPNGPIAQELDRETVLSLNVQWADEGRASAMRLPTN